MRIYSGSAWENVAVSTSGFATLTGVETLTNKTLTSPKINEDVVVTSTATELNLLDGVTSTTAELNILDGVTSTAAELNILDGVTSTPAELNILDGVTSTATEINKLDALSRGSIIYGNASAATTVLTKGTAAQVLTSDGTDIAWQDAAGGGTFSPRFSATLSSNQSISNVTQTVIANASENFDVGGCFNNTSGTVTLNGISTPAYSFAPNVAGLYVFGFKIFAVTNGNHYSIGYLFKNGDNLIETQWYNELGDARPHFASTIVSMNGSSDTVNLRYYQNSGGSLNVNSGQQNTHFFGYLLKAD